MLKRKRKVRYEETRNSKTRRKRKPLVNKRTLIVNKRRMETFVTNIDARLLQKKTLRGREYYVAPVVLMTHGVHRGSRGPVYYPGRELDKWSHSWNHKPITLGHPMKNGQNVSASDPDVMEESDLGFLLNTNYQRRKQRSFAWIDIESAKEKAPAFLAKVEAKEMVEVSTGLIVDEVEKRGEYGGKKFRAIAKNHRPDHLAILMDEVGACSLEDGAGLFQLNSAGSKNSKEEKVVMNRKKFVDALIANKATKWEEKDRKKLMAMDAEILVKLEPVPVKSGKPSTKTGLELTNQEEVDDATRRGAGVLDDDDDEDDEEEPVLNKKPAKAKKKTVLDDDDEEEEEVPVANKKSKKSEAQTEEEKWLAAAPPRAAAMLRNAMQFQDREKARYIKAILNSEKGKARFTKERLSDMSVEDIQDIAALLVPDEDEANDPLANFFGLGAPVANRRSAEQEEDEEGDLEIPVYNFDEEAGKKKKRA
jgi:hypothetical protein